MRKAFLADHAMLRTPLAALAFAVLFAGAANAQYTGPVPGTGGYDDRGIIWSNLPVVGGYRNPEDAGREREIEQRYQETLKTKIPDKKPSNDPWRTVRRAPAAPAYDRHRVE